MGTLHSAASVIQIHFRYLKHLRDAGLVRPAVEEPPAESTGREQMDIDIESSDYINSEA